MTSLRYLVCLPKYGCDHAGAAALKRCPTLSAIVQSEPVYWCNDESGVLDVGNGTTVVIGTLVAKGKNRPACGNLIDIDARRAGGPTGRHLIENYWGAYVAIEAGIDGGGHSVVRDPSGFMPCYRVDTDGHSAFASDVSALVAGGFVTAGIDWDSLFEHLQAPDVRRVRTCIEGVSELAPGFVAHKDSAPGEETMLWDPWAFADVRPMISADDQAEALRSVICSSISALASPFGHIMVGVSGGLDSSIVCAALAQSGARFTCLTMATADPSGDERPYARAVADALGAPLVAHIYRPEQIDPTRSASPHLPRPVGKAFMQEIERAYAEEVETRGIDAIFTGNGGDNLFCFLHSAAPIIDRLRAEGMSKGVGRTLLDMCAITECDIATMAKAVLTGLLRGARTPSPDMRLLNPDRSRSVATRPLTPYRDGAPTRFPGRRAHIDMLLGIQNYIEGYDRTIRPPVISPLLCQPIVEACLAIPSWQWCEGGINRSLARNAFRGMLPPSIVDRTSKAGPDSLMAIVFERNRSVLREQLLGGLLRRERIIDPTAVEAALADPGASRGQLFYRLLILAEAEAWARSWTDRLAGGAGHRG